MSGERAGVSKTVIDVHGLTKKFGDKTVVNNVDLSVAAGETVTQAREIADSLHKQRGEPLIGREPPEITRFRMRLEGAMDRIAIRSLLWTLACALVAVTGYAVTVYSDTWGTEIDIVSAFTAGFLTETIVNWALLPAFRTIRSRGRREPARPIVVRAESNGHGVQERVIHGEVT